MPVTTTDSTAADELEPRAAGAADATPGTDPLVEEDLLVEDVSIDGMCGVY